MIDLGLTADERAAFEATLISSHLIRTRVLVLDANEQALSSLDARVIEGSIQLDADSDVTRLLSLSLADPNRRLAFDSRGDNDLAIYADRFIAVEQGIYVDALERWIDVPVFWGIVSKFTRAGAIAKLEAQGKEALMLAPHLATDGYKVERRTSVGDAVRKVAGRVGETRFNIPELPGIHRLGRTRIVEPESEPWKVLRGGDQFEHFWISHRQRRRIAHGHGHGPGRPPGLVGSSGNLDCLYDGRGRLTVRRTNLNAVWTFTDDQIVGEPPAIDYDLERFVNYVLVRGGRAKGAKKSASGSARLPNEHPLSPHALARNGRPRFMSVVIDADGLKTDRQCRRRAQQELDKLSKEGVSVSFEGLPIPHLEEGDRVALRYGGESIVLPLRQATLPLFPAAASYGSNQMIRRR